MCARQRPGPRFDSVAVHERKFKKKKAPAGTGARRKTINKLTRGWGPVPVLDPDTGQVLGFRVEEVNRFDQRNQRTHKQYLYD